MSIDPEILRSNAPNAIDETVNVNHTECGDTRRRLYITRRMKGVVGYCHNCNGKGWAFTNGAGRPQAAVAPKTYRWPTNQEVHPDNWPPEARGWLLKYGITMMEATLNDIAFLPDSQRLMLPSSDRKSNITGWQERALFPYQKPKYLSRTLGNTTPSSVGCWKTTVSFQSHRVVVVEDCVSAIKLSKYCDAVAMLGTKLRPEVRNLIAENYEEAFVWLDPDAAGFTAAREVCGELELYLDTTHITSEVQPKEATDIEIRAHLGS